MTEEYNAIKNMLMRFKQSSLSKEDIKTTIKDILWNVNQIEKRKINDTITH